MSKAFTVDNILVREATLAERPVVAEITRLSYDEYASHSNPDFWTLYQATTRKTLLEEEEVLRIVALVADQIVATVLYCPPYEKRMGKDIVKNVFPEMRLLAVLPESRNLHIGAHLIDECERRAREQGFDAITLHTTVLMQTAKAMYERRGYQRYEAIDFEPVPGFVVWGYSKSLLA